MKKTLLHLVKSRSTLEGWDWFEKALQATAAPVDSNVMIGYYTGASRRLGKQALDLTDAEKVRLDQLHPPLDLTRWATDETGRAVLLLSLTHLPRDDFDRLVAEIYRQGDSREQQSWLRALGLLPGCERFLHLAVDACRTNIIHLFESIACENPYPALYFPELNFNQLVLKSLFNGIAIARTVNLESRLNPELSRMADDYVSEREAAGREVPTDIWLVLAPRIVPAGLHRVHRYLRHENPDHRYWAAVGLGLSGDPANRGPLQELHDSESDQKTRVAIEASLARLP